jgi:hypothetical protein
MFSVDLPSCAVPPRNDTVAGTHFGCLGLGAQNEPRRRQESISRADGGGLGWVSEGEAAYLGVGAGSPGSREATGEGGEGFYISRSGRRADLLASRGGGGP